MEVIISRLSDLGVHNAAEVVANCADNGRLAWLIDYMIARESLHKAEVETYVR